MYLVFLGHMQHLNCALLLYYTSTPCVFAKVTYRDSLPPIHCNLRASALKGRQVNKSKQQHVLFALVELTWELYLVFRAVCLPLCGFAEGKSICLALLRIRIAGQYSTHSHNEKWLAAAVILLRSSSSCVLPTHSNREQLILVIIKSS